MSRNRWEREEGEIGRESGNLRIFPKRKKANDLIFYCCLFLLFFFSCIPVGKTDDHIKVLDDVPSTAVELQVKDKVSLSLMPPTTIRVSISCSNCPIAVVCV